MPSAVAALSMSAFTKQCMMAAALAALQDLTAHACCCLTLVVCSTATAPLQMPERMPHPNGVLDQRLVSSSRMGSSSM
jgi:hypothetical protein